MDPEQESYEDLSNEEEGIVESPKQAKNISKPTQNQEETQEEDPVDNIPEVRYVAYKSPQVEGIIDTETNLPVGTETNVILAEILNKIDNIEKSTG